MADINNTNRTQSEISQLNLESQNLFDYYHNATTPAVKYKDTILNAESLKGKNICFLTISNLPMKELKKLCNVVKIDSKDIDIIVYATRPYVSSRHISINNRYQSIYNEKSQKEIDLIETLLSLHKDNIINDKIKLIRSCNIKININLESDEEILNTKELLTPDMILSIHAMLQSSDKEIFNLGWKFLWQYKYEANKNAILLLVKDCNPSTFYHRNKNNNIEYCYKQWKKLWKNY